MKVRSLSRKHVRIGGTCALLVLSIIVAYDLISSLNFRRVPTVTAAQSLAFVPYTVVLGERIYARPNSLRPGVHDGATYTYARRMDGSYVELTTSELPKVSVRLILLASGAKIKIDDVRKVTNSMKDDTSILVARDPQAKCQNDFLGRVVQPNQIIDGEDMIGGYRTIRIKVLGGHDSVRWYAPELSCAMLQTRVNFAEGDAEEKYLVNVIPGEPSVNLFTIPAEYRELPTSEFMGINDPELIKQVDSVYYSRKLR